METKKNGFDPANYKRTLLVLCGGTAGAFAKTVVSPLERVRIMTQTGSSSYGVIGTVREITRREGIKGFWRGNFANVIRIVPHKGVLFMTNDSYRKLIATLSGNDVKSMSVGWSFVAGSLAGISATAATYPLDVIRTRLAGLFADGRSSSIVGTAMAALRAEGPRAFFQGMTPTILGSIPYEGIKFGCYDSFKKSLAPYSHYLSFAGGDGMVLTSVLAGALGATIAGVVIYPNDTVRRLMQIEGEGGKKRKYKNIRDCWIKTYQEHGVKRFFRGMPTYVVRMIPNAAIQFATYEYLKKTLHLAL